MWNYKIVYISVFSVSYIIWRKQKNSVKTCNLPFIIEMADDTSGFADSLPNVLIIKYHYTIANQMIYPELM